MTTEYEKCREHVRGLMNEYRLGMRPLPRDYITLHKCAARADTDNLLAQEGLEHVESEMVSDGWCDGMRVLEVLAKEPGTGEPRTFRWSDANGGSWFERLLSGAQVLYRRPEQSPGHL